MQRSTSESRTSPGHGGNWTAVLMERGTSVSVPESRVVWGRMLTSSLLQTLMRTLIYYYKCSQHVIMKSPVDGFKESKTPDQKLHF